MCKRLRRWYQKHFAMVEEHQVKEDRATRIIREQFTVRRGRKRYR